MDFEFDIGAIKLGSTIKSLGRYIVDVNLFGDVSVNIRLNVCRTSADFEMIFCYLINITIFDINNKECIIKR